MRSNSFSSEEKQNGFRMFHPFTLGFAEGKGSYQYFHISSNLSLFSMALWHLEYTGSPQHPEPSETELVVWKSWTLDMWSNSLLPKKSASKSFLLLVLLQDRNYSEIIFYLIWCDWFLAFSQKEVVHVFLIQSGHGGKEFQSFLFCHPVNFIPLDYFLM